MLSGWDAPQGESHPESQADEGKAIQSFGGNPMRQARLRDHGPATWDRPFDGGFMKIQTINIKNILALDQVTLNLQTPINIIAGANEK
jgi:hypothetical protein